MPPPRFETCDLCGKKFSSASLGIHMKQCIAKREASTSFCPVCDHLCSNDEYESHVSECRIVNAKLVKAKKDAAAKSKLVVAASAGDAAASSKPRSKVPEHVLARMAAMGEPPEARLNKRLGQPCDACGAVAAIVACMGCHAVYCKPCSVGIHEANKALSEHTPVTREDLAAASAAAAALAAIDSRTECTCCHRKFASDRIAKHNLICAKLTSKKPRKAFMSTEEARLRGTDFKAFQKLRTEPPPPPSRWRTEHEQILAVAAAEAAVAAAAAAAAAATAGSAPVSNNAAEAAVDASASAAAPAEEAAVPVAKAKKPAMRVGDKVVILDKGLVGVLQFKGPVWGMKKGTWFGVEFHDLGAIGDSDGSYDGVHYFYCPENHGVFARPENVRLHVEGEVVVPQPPKAAPAEATPSPAKARPAPAATASAAPADIDAEIVILVGGRRKAGAAATTAAAPAPAAAPAAPMTAAPTRPASRDAATTTEPSVRPASASKPAAAAAATTAVRPPSATLRAPADVSVGVTRPASGGRSIVVAGAVTSAVAAPAVSTARSSMSRGSTPATVARPLSGSGAMAARPLSATRAKAVVAPAAGAAAPSVTTKPTVLSTSGKVDTRTAAVRSSPSKAAAPVAKAAPTKAAVAPAATSTRTSAAAASKPAVPVRADTTKKPARGASSGPTTRAPKADPVSAAREAALTRVRAAEAEADAKRAAAAAAAVASTPAAAVAPRADITTATPSTAENDGAAGDAMDKGLVSRLRTRVEHERAAAEAAPVGVKSTRQRLAELAAAEGNAPVPAASVRPPSAGVRATPVLSSDMDPRTRDIMRNVDYLRVLAGEKSKLAAEDAPIKPSYAAFSGSAHRIGGGDGGTAAVAAAESTGEKRRIVVAGQLQIAKGASDTPAEMARRAAALRARMTVDGAAGDS